MAIVKCSDAENEWVDDVVGDHYWIDCDASGQRKYMVNQSEITEDDFCWLTQRIKRTEGLKSLVEWRNIQGALHREDGPAFVQHREDGVKIYGHYHYGKMHREGGPAHYTADGKTHLYCQNGLLHRDENEGPAHIHDGYEAYYNHGYLHRLSGPAYILKENGANIPLAYALDGKILSSEEWKAQSPDSNVEMIDDGESIRFYKKGTSFLHRTAGPAVVYRDDSFEYWVDGDLHRAGGLPALVRSNGSEEYWVKGVVSRDPTAGPALIQVYDDGHVVSTFKVDGKLLDGSIHGASIIYEDEEGMVSYKEFYDHNNHLHRFDGPAIENSDGSGTYWIYGNSVSEDEFLSGSVGINCPDGVRRHYMTGETDRPTYHNPYGMAVVYQNGKGEYWLEGDILTHEQWLVEREAYLDDDILETDNEFVVPTVEKVFRCQLVPEPGWTYYFDSSTGNIKRWREAEDTSKAIDEVVLKTDVLAEDGCIYFLDTDGDVCKATTINAVSPVEHFADDFDIEIEVVKEEALPVSDAVMEEVAGAISESTDSTKAQQADDQLSWGSIGVGALALGLLKGLADRKKATKPAALPPTQAKTQEAVSKAIVSALEPVKVKR